MIDAAGLLKDTRSLVKELVDDLRQTAINDPAIQERVDAEWADAKTAGRTGLAKASWEDGLFAQVAVGWVLAGSRSAAVPSVGRPVAVQPSRGMWPAVVVPSRITRPSGVERWLTTMPLVGERLLCMRTTRSPKPSSKIIGWCAG